MNASLLNGKLATEKALLAKGYRKYTGRKIDVFYQQSICQHAGECVRGNSDVFEIGRRPWIKPDAANNLELERVLNHCPSGALKFIYHGGEN